MPTIKILLANPPRVTLDRFTTTLHVYTRESSRRYVSTRVAVAVKVRPFPDMYV